MLVPASAPEERNSPGLKARSPDVKPGEGKKDLEEPKNSLLSSLVATLPCRPAPPLENKPNIDKVPTTLDFSEILSKVSEKKEVIEASIDMKSMDGLLTMVEPEPIKTEAPLTETMKRWENFHLEFPPWRSLVDNHF